MLQSWRNESIGLALAAARAGNAEARRVVVIRVAMMRLAMVSLMTTKHQVPVGSIPSSLEPPTFRNTYPSTPLTPSARHESLPRLLLGAPAPAWQ